VLSPQNHLGIQVQLVNLSNELTASPARWQHKQRAIVVTPNRHDLRDVVFAGRDHRSYRGMLCAKTSSGCRVDADARVTIPGCCDEHRGDVAEETVTRAMGVTIAAASLMRSVLETPAMSGG